MTVIHTLRFVYIHHDSSCTCIKIGIYTSGFAYKHQDSYINIKIRIYTSRFAYIHQDWYIYQLSYEATHWEQGQFIEFISSRAVKSREIYIK